MIDIEALLEPISAESPCGEDLSFSSEFDAIQEARRSDDATLDQGEWVSDLKTSDWFSVSRQCGTLLRTRSKDLRLAVWLAEASSRMDGFAGLAAGYRLVAGLCDRYWDHIHPEADGDDHDLRVGNLSWLLTQSSQWARGIPLTNAPNGRFDAIALEVAVRGLGSSDGNSDYPDTSRIDAARAATPFEFYQQLAEQAPLVLDALKELESVVDGRLGDHGPSFSAARDTVGDVVRSALRMASAAGATSLEVAAPPPLPGSAPAETTSAPVPATVAAAPGEITNRRDALLQLRRVADFFRRTEPHSPVAYLADKAARWGNMPLHVWLKTVVKDSNALSQLEDLLDVGTDESRNS